MNADAVDADVQVSVTEQKKVENVTDRQQLMDIKLKIVLMLFTR